MPSSKHASAVLTKDGALVIGAVTGLTAEARIARYLCQAVEAGGGEDAGAEQAAERLAAQGCTALLSVGLAGGLAPGLPPGTVIIPESVIPSPSEGEGGAHAQRGRVRVRHAVPVQGPATLSLALPLPTTTRDARCVEGGGSLTDGWTCDAGLIARLGGATHPILLGGGTVLATAAAKRAAHAVTGAAAVDLESAAVARVAARHGLPFAVLRAVCDPAERDLPPAALAALDARGRIGALRVLASVLRRPAQIPLLIRLGQDAALARRALLSRIRRVGPL